MNDITELMFDRFGFKYKKIPAGYIRDRLTFALQTKNPDIDYLRLLYGYVAEVGTADDVSLLREGLASHEDPFLQRCTKALESGKGKRAVRREFRSIFKKNASHHGAYCGFFDELKGDGVFTFFAAAAFVVLLLPMLFSVAVHEYSLHIVPFLIPACISACIAVFRAASIIPRGSVRTKTVTSAFGWYLILISVLLIVYESLYMPSDDGNGSSDGLIFLVTTPLAILCLLFAYVYEIRDRIFCNKAVKGRIVFYRQTNTPTTRSRMRQKGVDSMGSMVVTYIVRGVAYYRKIDEGRLIFKQAPSFKRGGYTDLFIDPKHPECVRHKDAVPFLSIVSMILAAALLVGSVISILV